MRRLVLFILACTLLLPFTAHAYDVLVLQSKRDAPCDEVVKGLRTERSFSQRLMVISDYAELDLPRLVREEQPRLIIAIGDAALREARKAQPIPVIALMTLAAPVQSPRYPNQTGIGMMAPPERYMRVFQNLRVHRVGVIYSPAWNGWYMRQARQAALQAGIELVTREVNDSQEVVQALRTLVTKVDCLWMPADLTAVTRETSEQWMREAGQHGVPLVTFSSVFLNMGATAAVDLDRVEMGRQAARMAQRILQGENVAEIAPEWPRNGQIKGNLGLLKRLGVNLEELKSNQRFLSGGQRLSTLR